MNKNLRAYGKYFICIWEKSEEYVNCLLDIFCYTDGDFTDPSNSVAKNTHFLVSPEMKPVLIHVQNKILL